MFILTAVGLALDYHLLLSQYLVQLQPQAAHGLPPALQHEAVLVALAAPLLTPA